MVTGTCADDVEAGTGAMTIVVQCMVVSVLVVANPLAACLPDSQQKRCTIEPQNWAGVTVVNDQSLNSPRFWSGGLR